MDIKKIIHYGIIIVEVIFLLWVVISYIEIITKNTGENPQYYFWNFFQLLVNKF